MWQRFTERARRAIFFAQEEAGQLGQNLVTPEHLLLGLIRENDTVAARVLDRLGVDLAHLRSEIERQVARGDGRSGQDMQLTPESKRVVDFAYDEARQLDNNYIDTEHLLLGLIRREKGISAETLIGLGAGLERTRAEVMAIQDVDLEAKGDSSKQRPAVGDIGTLISASGREAVEVAAEPDAFGELIRVFLARDGFGYRQMHEGGRFFVAPVGTRLKQLQALPNEQFTAGRSALLVRILDGEFAGRKGWVALNEFERVGPDDAPFPSEP